MSGTLREIGHPPPEIVSQIARDARRERSQAIAALLIAAGRGIRAILRGWFHHQPTAPFAGGLSGRMR
jgi:hypothetical protein